MAQDKRFQPGDEVVHPRRPEWGAGVVRLAETITHEGSSAQRLTIDFEHRGRVVINTAVAPLTDKGNDTPMSSTSTSISKPRNGGWLGALEQAAKGGNGQTHELWELHESLTDPFASLPQRLAATLDSFRFSTEPRSLIEWAIAQTGLKDPMTRYTRQELEQGFTRFARDRDQHLKLLVQQIKRSGDRRALDQARRNTRHRAAQSALDKAIHA